LVRYRQGRIDEVRADADLYPDLAAPSITDLLLAAVHTQALIDVGALDEAEAVAAPIAALPIDRTLTVYQPFAEAAAVLRLARRDPRGALDTTTAMAAWEEEMDYPGGRWVPWRSYAALAHSALGEEEQALELAEEQVALAREFGADGNLGFSLRVL